MTSDCMLDHTAISEQYSFVEAKYLVNTLEAQFGRHAPWTLSSRDVTKMSERWRDTLPCQTKAIEAGMKVITPAEDYINEYVLGLSEGIGICGNIRWQNTLCFLFSWGLIFVVLKAGIKEAGKVIWFSALFPYFVLTIFLIRAATLDGADYGVSYYIDAVF